MGEWETRRVGVGVEGVVRARGRARQLKARGVPAGVRAGSASRGAGVRAGDGQATLWGGAGGRQGTLFLRGARWTNFFIDFFGRLACLSQGSPVGQVYSKKYQICTHAIS